MTCYTIGQKYGELPDILPIFPLTGVLLLPRGHLPLNIFEPRYLAMVDEAMAGARLIGMIQCRPDKSLYPVGCAGRIINYNETPDGRYEITLCGVSRFRVKEELEVKNGFRRAAPDWDDFQRDLEPMSCLDMDRPRLTALLKTYFTQQGMTCNWQAIEGAPDEKLITSLAMVCPFDPKEKQALLEAGCCKERAKIFMTMLEIAINDASRPHPSRH